MIAEPYENEGLKLKTRVESAQGWWDITIWGTDMIRILAVAADEALNSITGETLDTEAAGYLSVLLQAIFDKAVEIDRGLEYLSGVLAEKAGGRLETKEPDGAPKQEVTA